jgi:hypothetical protein
MLGAKLRVLGALGVKLGAWLGGGLNEGRDGAENDPPEPNDGPEGADGADLNDGAGGIDGAGLGALNDGLDGIDGACLGALNDGPGWLGLVNGLDRPEPTDEPGGCENDLCWTLDMRSANELRRELSCPRSRLPAIGEISTAAVTATRAPRDRIVFLVNILLLLPWSPVVRHPQPTATHQKQPPYHNYTVFKALEFAV